MVLWFGGGTCDGSVEANQYDRQNIIYGRSYHTLVLHNRKANLRRLQRARNRIQVTALGRDAHCYAPSMT
jgi:hypothetical protein